MPSRKRKRRSRRNRRLQPFASTPALPLPPISTGPPSPPPLPTPSIDPRTSGGRAPIPRLDQTASSLVKLANTPRDLLVLAYKFLVPAAAGVFATRWILGWQQLPERLRGAQQNMANGYGNLMPDPLHPNRVITPANARQELLAHMRDDLVRQVEDPVLRLDPADGINGGRAPPPDDLLDDLNWPDVA